MGPCCDDHRQPRMYGRSCSPGCTSPVLWHSVCADSCPRFPSRKYPAVLLLRTRGQPSPHVVENAPEATSMAPCGYRPRAFRCVLRLWAPASSWPSPTTGTFHVAGCVSFRAGAFDAVGDSIPVPGRAGRPRPHRNVPARAGCPQPRRLSAGRPWQPESLVQRVRRRRRRTTTSGPHTGARSGQAGKARPAPGEEAPRPEVEAPSCGVRVPGPHRSGWLIPIPAARRVRRGPPGAPGYGHRPAPAHCAGGP